eukprot:76744-Pyramimonas_sp.AAC.1
MSNSAGGRVRGRCRPCLWLPCWPWPPPWSAAAVSVAASDRGGRDDGCRGGRAGHAVRDGSGLCWPCMCCSPPSWSHLGSKAWNSM